MDERILRIEDHKGRTVRKPPPRPSEARGRRMRAEERAKNARSSAPTRRGNNQTAVTHVPGLICYLCPRSFRIAGVAIWALRPAASTGPQSVSRFVITLPVDQQGLGVGLQLAAWLLYRLKGRIWCMRRIVRLHLRAIDQLNATPIQGTEVVAAVLRRSVLLAGWPVDWVLAKRRAQESRSHGRSACEIVRRAAGYLGCELGSGRHNCLRPRAGRDLARVRPGWDPRATRRRG